MSDQTTINVVLSSESVVGNPIIETVTVVGTVPIGPRGATGATGATGAAGAAGATGPAGADGEGVPVGGTAGQVLTKDSGTDFDTSWQDAAGGGSGVVETVVAGSGVSVDSTDPANPIVTAQVTQAELDAEATTRANADTALDGRVDALEAVDPLTQTEGDALYWPLATDLATQAELNAEAALARNADNLTSGTVADARIASTIARDSEVTAAVSASEAGQVRDGDAAGGVLSGTYPNPGFAADMATQAELDAHVTDTTDAHDASAISFSPTGTIAATDVQAAIEEVASEAGGGSVDDTAYDATSWNGVTATAPSKNAVRDKFEAITGAGGIVDIEQTTLTDKTSWAATSTLEQWGTEEAVLAQASAPAAAKVWAVLSGTARNLDGANNRGGDVRVEISLDGGSSWANGPATYYEIIGSASGNPATGVAAQHVVSGAVTGDIQARARSQVFTATTGPDLIRGIITITVIPA